MYYIDYDKFAMFLKYTVPFEVLFIILAVALYKQSGTLENIGKFTMERTAEGLKLSLQMLKFVPESTNLLPGQDKVLDEIAEILLQNPSGRFLLVGHVNGEPGSAFETKKQMSLSLGRAETVARELRFRSVPSRKMKCEGRGCTQPIVHDFQNEKVAWRNRRVEIFIR